ncbi:hypothetical protein JL720_589 [Aureococcus anophagefferens]|nr:hypothetical protein JL720_589 [Aureococcus anophagefferens]
MGRRQPPPVTPEPALIPEEAMLLGGALLAASVVHVLTKRLSSSKRLVVRVGATFGISYVLGVRFLAGIKAGLGVDALGDLDAFGPLWTLSGLLFSVMLGQTYQYYFDRQGAIQDAAFEETLALWRLSQLVTTTINDLHAVRLSAAADLLVEFDLGNDEPSQLGDVCASRRAESAAGVQCIHDTVRDIHRCAAKRVSNINADLPPLQWHALSAFGVLLNPFEGLGREPGGGSLEKFVAHMLEKHATLVRAHSKRAVTQVRASLRLAGTGNGVASLRKSADEASFSEKGGM